MPASSSKPKVAANDDIFTRNFRDIAPAMNANEALIEANRCLYCYDAPCIQACPTHIDIPRFIKQVASDNLTGSAKTIMEANALGHSCAHVCPVEALCEGSCVFLGWHEKPIEIARLQRRATDHMHETGEKPFKPGKDNGKKVAVIGAGPAGLACASYLRRLGHPVTMFDRRPKAGGLNTYGIAEYKMTRPVSDVEIKQILDLGVDLRLGAEVGKTIALEKLEQEFQAIFVGIGLGETRSLRIPGESLLGVFDALSFIEPIKAHDVKGLGTSQVTVVVGAGNTAIDAATQAKRLGAKRVIMAYRRGPEDRGAYDYEMELAKKDEIEFLWNAAPVSINGSKKVESIRFARTKPGKNGGEPEVVAKSEFDVPCDRVIKAIGQTKHYSLAKAANMKLDPAGRIAVDPMTLRTSNSRYFAGGDAVNGGKEVVNAAADGKRAAWHIHRALMNVEKPAPEHAYWVSTIEGRKVAPIPARMNGKHLHG